MRLLAWPFFTSGLAALSYQLCWQRLLFVAFGVDIESVTIVVSAFMLGLGVGALIGGQLADHKPHRVVACFAGAEWLIGIFALGSPELIAWTAHVTLEQSPFIVALANFLLLLVPTTLMGATLPMLVAFLVRRSATVGVSIGGLYFVNTLGAATGAAATGFLVFHYLDIVQTIYAAAFLNFLAGSLVLWLFRAEQS